MITALAGRLERVGPDWAEITVGGVTLRVHVPAITAQDLGPPGGRVSLHTSFQVRDDGMALYGFSTPEARDAFEVLLGINGVGPRVALAILGRFTPDALAAVVHSGDVDAFTVVPGVGKKTAGRILLELRGRLEQRWEVPTAEDAEAVDALRALGYSAAEARAALAAIAAEDMPLEERIRLALQRMAQG